MKNRILVFVVAFVAIAIFKLDKLSAQTFPVNLGLYPKNIQVSTINGVDAKDVYTLDLQVPYGENIVEPWSIAVRITSPIELQGTTIPSEKICIRFNKVTGKGGISLGDVGVNNQEKYELNHNTPISLINATNTVLKNNKTYEFHFDIIVEGGNYLTKLIPWQPYPFGLTFYITVGAQITIIERGIDFRVSEIKGDNTIPDFGFEVFADASLNFNVPEDYTRKVESSEESWLKVISKDKGYTVNVQTSDSNFEGESDIPVGVVSMQVEDKKGSRTGPEIALKNSGQNVFNGNATGSEPRKLDVRYFISPDNAKELAIYKPGAYVTRLTYTLLPQ